MVGKLPKYQQIRDHILGQIESGELQTGDRLPVRSELIKHYQVTRTTMDKALNELIQNGFLASSKRGGTVVAQSPQKRKRIAVVSRLNDAAVTKHQTMPNDIQRMFATMILSAHNVADIIFLDTDQVRQEMKQLEGYDACVWVQPDHETLLLLEKSSKHIYVTNRYHPDVNYVSTNHRAAIRAVTEYYIEHLPADIDLLYVDSAHDTFIKKERQAGFIEACGAHRREYRQVTVPHDFETALSLLMKANINLQRCTVIVSISCIMEAAILEMAKQRGLHRGENFFYADCDNESVAQGHRPAALTIIQDYPQIGELVLRAAIEGVSSKTFVPFMIKGSRQFLLGD